MPQASPQATTNRRLIVTLHGIRTYGQWQKKLEEMVAESDSSVSFRHFRYGYFSALAFIFPFTRWLMTRRFRSHLRAAVREEQWSRIDIVAHSFGTHLAAWGIHGIQAEDRPKVHTLILAGSVLKPSFAWRDLVSGPFQCVDRVVNECGTKDSILVMNQIAVLGTGMAGRVGFSGMESSRFHNRFYRLGHSGYFKQPESTELDPFMKRHWVPILTSEDEVQPIDERKSLSPLSGFLEFLLNNTEPAKLLIYFAPLLFLVYYVNNLRLDAIHQRNEARQEVQASASYSLAEKDPTLALQLAAGDGTEKLLPTAELALLRAFNTGSWLYSHRIESSKSSDLAPNGDRLAWISEERELRILDLSSGDELLVPSASTHIRFWGDSHLVGWTQSTSHETLGVLEIMSNDGRVLERFDRLASRPSISNEHVLASAWSTQTDQITVHIVDRESLNQVDLQLPSEFVSPNLSFAASADGSTVAVAQADPPQLAVSMQGSPFFSAALPEGLRPRSVSLNSTGERLATFLTSRTTAENSFLGWTDLDDDYSASPFQLELISFEDNSESSTGKTYFLPNGAILVALMSGLAEIIDLDSGERIEFARVRGFDAIDISAEPGLIAVARRSGTVSVYDVYGRQLGSLLGESASSWGEPAFRNISFSEDGETLLTQSKDTARIWRSPRLPLTLAHDESFALLEDLPHNLVEHLERLSSGEDVDATRVNPSRELHIDDFGILALNVEMRGRSDLLPTRLSRRDIDIATQMELTQLPVFRIAGHDIDRLFVLSANLIREFVVEERELGRIWQPPTANVDDTVQLVAAID